MTVSDNFLLSASVAEFGLLLRNSMFKGSAGYENIIGMMKKCNLKDEFGYLAEFINLVENCHSFKE